MKQQKFIAIGLSAVLALGLLAGCASGGKSSPVKIVATDNGWDSQKIHTAIAKLVVEHAYDGYTLEVSTASSTMNWQAMIAGDVDLDIESWTDNVATYADDIKNGSIVDVGILVPDSWQGLYVPRYVVEGDAARGIAAMAPGLKTVEDLKKYPEVFPDFESPGKGRIYGSLPGWMADEILYQKFEAYGLDEAYNYIRLGSEATLFASLSSAYNLGEAWVGYCYEPTVITGKLDLLLLEDVPYDPALYMAGKCAFPAQALKIVSSNQFAEKAPDLLGFFANYQTGSVMIAQALAHMDEAKESHEQTAIWVLKNNDSMLDQWLPKENATKLRDYLNTQP